MDPYIFLGMTSVIRRHGDVFHLGAFSTCQAIGETAKDIYLALQNKEKQRGCRQQLRTTSFTFL